MSIVDVLTYMVLALTACFWVTFFFTVKYLRVRKIAGDLVNAVYSAARKKGILGIIVGKDGKVRFEPMKCDGVLIKTRYGYAIPDPNAIYKSDIKVPVAIFYADYGVPLRPDFLVAFKTLKEEGVENIVQLEREFEKIRRENPREAHELTVAANPNAHVLAEIYSTVEEELGKDIASKIVSKVSKLPIFNLVPVRVESIVGWMRYWVNQSSINARISYEVSKQMKMMRAELVKIVSLAIAAAIVIFALVIAARILGVV